MEIEQYSAFLNHPREKLEQFYLGERKHTQRAGLI